MFGLCFRIQVRVLVHQIPHAHVLLAEGVILIKRLVAAMLTGRTAHRTQQKPPRRSELPVPAGRLFARWDAREGEKTRVIFIKKSPKEKIWNKCKKLCKNC